MKVVGLTGGIGSGKSTVANMLAELGAYIIDADELARRIVEPGQPAWKEIEKNFGGQILNPDQTLNRKKMAEIVFANPEARKKLESITHPRIGEEMMRELEKAKKEQRKLVVFDAALLIESAAANRLKPLIVVSADEDLRVKRVCGRDRCCAEDVRARIRNQVPDSKRREKADFVIENNGDIDQLREGVSELYRKLID